jgi:integrase
MKGRLMAYIAKVRRTAKDGRTRTVYLARHRLPGGRVVSRSFGRETDARRWLATQEADKARGEWIDPRAGSVTFKEYAEAWRLIQVWRPSTAAAAETYLRRHVYPHLGHLPVRAIRRSHIQTMVKALTGELAPASVVQAYRWTVPVFRAAGDDKVIAENPCRDIRLPCVDKPKVVPLSTEIVSALIDGVPDRWSAVIVLGAGTGVRVSEALGLTNDRVDWMRRTVTIDRQLVGVRDGLPVFGPVKDRRNRPRTIPLPDMVVATLVDHVRRYGLGPEGLLFTNRDGEPIRRTTFSDMWRTKARPLGIPEGDGFHQLRHYYASLLIRHGESVKVVQERLGHASAVETLDTYSHLWPDEADGTRAAVDEVLGPARTTYDRTNVAGVSTGSATADR